MIVYPAILNVSARLVSRLTRFLNKIPRRTHRKLSARKQTILALAYLRKGETFAALAVGFGIATSTCHTYINEAINVWRRHRRPLKQALATRAARDQPLALDGSLIPIDRLWHPRGVKSPYYSGKHHRYGLNIQGLGTTRGDLLWLSHPLPGAIHDKKASTPTTSDKHWNSPDNTSSPIWVISVPDTTY